MRYHYNITAQVVGYAKEDRADSYTVIFNSNGGTGTMENQTIKYDVSTKLNPNTFTKTDYSFNGWNTQANGTGTEYSDEQEINNTTEETITLYAQWVQGVAEVNGTYYDSLQEAVNAVPKNNTETIVKLLKDVSENITVEDGQNIVFNLQNYTVSHKNTTPVITNNGKIKITNGTIIVNHTNSAAINNESTGTLTITGGRIMMTKAGGKQAIYNNKGTVNISEDAYISSVSSIRGAVHNLADGTLNITGGTIISEHYCGVQNLGSLTIGIEDGNVNKNSPVMQGATYGVNSTVDFRFYDGIAKGKTKALSLIPSEDNIESGYEVTDSEESTYKTAYLAISKTVTFDNNDGSSTSTKRIEVGNKVGTLPTPKRLGYSLDGWFTLSEGGEQITEDTIITEDITFYAHWTRTTVAEINGVEYNSIQAAVNNVPTDNTLVTIKLLKDTDEAVTVKANQNIYFDLNDHKMIRNDGDKAVIKNRGTIEIANGDIFSDADNGALDNDPSGHMIINGTRVIASGTRQAVYNDAGYVEIKGNSYLSSTAIEAPSTTGVELARATIQNIHNGTIKITDATIICTTQQAISNEGTLIIGIEGDGNISTSSPSITGKTYGIVSTITLNYYDGIIKGIDDAVSGTITNQETNTQIVNGTEVISGETYKTIHLDAT